MFLFVCNLPSSEKWHIVTRQSEKEAEMSAVLINISCLLYGCTDAFLRQVCCSQRLSSGKRESVAPWLILPRACPEPLLPFRPFLGKISFLVFHLCEPLDMALYCVNKHLSKTRCKIGRSRVTQ